MSMNSFEKMAAQNVSIDSDCKHFVMNGESAEVTLHREKQIKFNDQVQEYVDKFEKHNEALKDYAKQLSEDINGLEIMPLYGFVLIKPFDNNPFQQIKTTSSGIITDLGGMALEYKSNETGEIEEEEQFIKVGTVIETGHKCEFVKPGDIVFYTKLSETIVPFYKQGFVVVNENRLMAVVNEKLTERRDGIRR